MFRRKLVLSALIAAFAAVPVLLAVQASASTPGFWMPPHHQVSTNGRQIGQDLHLTPGQNIELTVPGFAPNSTVHEQIACTQALSVDAMTGSDGVLHPRIHIPNAMDSGTYLLTFTGAPPTAESPARGTLQVSVPQTAFVRFTIGGARVPTVTCP